MADGVLLLCMPPATQLPEALRGELELDRSGGVPVGAQLAHKLEALIAGELLKPGDQLPSVRMLADAAGVNVNTARSVYARLEQRGLLSSEHGRGTFVRGVRAEPAPAAGSDREYRRELMRQVVELERQVAYYTRHQLVGAPETPRTRPASQLLPSTDLMGIRDELQQRVAELRAIEEDRLGAISEQRAATQAAEQDERAREVQTAGRRAARGTAEGSPRIVSGPGAWVLRWRT